MPKTRTEAMNRIMVLAIVVAAPICAQPVRTGQILIATAASHDPDFARTVVLIVHSDARGVAGLFINRPTDADILRVLPELQRAPSSGKTVYAGGPLALGINALLRSKIRPAHGTRIAADIWLLADTAAIAAAVSRDARSVRVYIGQCGWSVQQMQSEIARKLWFISMSDGGLVFDAHPETLWKRLSGRLEK